jgi:hypothetical protein
MPEAPGKTSDKKKKVQGIKACDKWSNASVRRRETDVDFLFVGGHISSVSLVIIGPFSVATSDTDHLAGVWPVRTDAPDPFGLLPRQINSILRGKPLAVCSPELGVVDIASIQLRFGSIVEGLPILRARSNSVDCG